MANFIVSILLYILTSRSVLRHFIFFIVNFFTFTTKDKDEIIEKNECIECANKCSEYIREKTDKYEENMRKLFENCKKLLLLTLILMLLVIYFFRNLQLSLFTFNIVILSLWILSFSNHVKSTKNVTKIFKDMDNRNYIFYYKYLSPLIIGIAFVTGCSHGALPWKDKYIFSDLAMVETIDNFQVYGEILFFLDKVVVLREQGHKELLILPEGRIYQLNFHLHGSQ